LVQKIGSNLINSIYRSGDSNGVNASSRTEQFCFNKSDALTSVGPIEIGHSANLKKLDPINTGEDGSDAPKSRNQP
jgi:hypothetical protein